MSEDPKAGLLGSGAAVAGESASDGGESARAGGTSASGAGASASDGGASTSASGRSLATTGATEADAISRRGALKVIAATAALGTAASCAPGDTARSTESAHEALSGFEPLPPANPRAAGTPTDPDMLAPVVPWDMVLTDEEMRQVAALADVIIPADTGSPAASAVGVPDYINEFVSAPAHTEQLTQLRGGLAWLNRIARERFGADFADCTAVQQSEYVGELDAEVTGLREDPEASASNHFFHHVKRFTITAYFTSEVGLAALGHRTSFRTFEGCALVSPLEGGPPAGAEDAHAPGPAPAEGSAETRAPIRNDHP